MTGKIIKGVGGFYYVVNDGTIYTCKAKGIFRKNKMKPLVGDMVDFTPPSEGDDTGNIIEIKPRTLELIRPAVSNVDLVMVVMSLAKPDPQLFLLDRYLVHIEMEGIPSAILFTKTDLDETEMALNCSDIYKKAGYDTFTISSMTSEGISEVREFIEGKTVVLAGASGVGKSTFTNLICPEATMETNTISTKIDRGRHTTRHSELFVIDSNTFMCDTPGFSSVYIDNCDASELKNYYKEIAKYSGKCRFNGCNHISEPNCLVKQAVSDGTIAQSRYDSYVKMYEELNGRKKY